MKKKGLLLGAVLVSTMLSACAGNSVTQNTEVSTESGTEAVGESESESSATESTQSFKIFNDGEDYSDLAYDMTREQNYGYYFYRKNGWIYGTSWDPKTGKSRFQKIRDNQEDRIIISPNTYTNKIEEYEGNIYSISNLTTDNGDQFGLCKTRDSGEGIQLIVPNAVNFQIETDGLSYELNDENGNQKLYYCDFDGGNSKLILDGNTYYHYIIDGNVIYQDDSDGESIKVLNQSTGEVTKLTNRHSWSPILDGKCLYYKGAETGLTDETIQTLYKLDLKTMDEVSLKEHVGGALQYVDGWLYFQNPDDGNRLYKIDTDGNNLQMVLQNPEASDIQVKSDGILYAIYSKDTSGNITGLSNYYWCQLDGSSPEDLATSDSWWVQ